MTDGSDGAPGTAEVLETHRFDERALHRRRVDANLVLQIRENARGIEKGKTIVNLGEIDVVVKSVRVTEIVIASDDAARTVVDHRGDALEIAIEPIDLRALDTEPGPAVDPRTPGAELGHFGRRFVQSSSHLSGSQ